MVINKIKEGDMDSKDIKYFKSYYEEYPDKFIEDYLGIELMWYQKILIKLIRGGDKSGRRK